MAGRYKTYPEYQDSGEEWLGEVPAHWKVIQIRHLSAVKRGASPRPIDDAKYFNEEGEYAWTRIADVSASDVYLMDAPQRLSALGSSLSVKLEPGELFLSIAGTVGKPCLTGIKACIHDGFVYFPELRIPSKYLFYIFAGEQAYKGLGKFGTQLNLNTDTVGGIKVGCPSNEDMEQIISFLDHETGKIDALIAKQQALITLLQEKRQAVISHAVTKGLNPEARMKDSGVEWLGEVPEHWKIQYTKRLFSLECHPSPSNNGMELLSVYTEIGVRPRRELEQKGNKASSTDGYWLVKKGDLVVNKLLAWMGAVGYSNYDGVTSPAYDILRKRVPLNPKFYHYLFRSKIAQHEFKRWSRGIMEMRLRLYFDELGQIAMPYPSEGEQDEIVAKIEGLEGQFETLIEKAEDQINLLQERRTALISAAVTGKIDVRDWEPSPEA
jgi:type I restriction enzyme S subunit